VSKTIIKRKVTNKFTVIPNDCFNDLHLSGEELGVISYLLSRPDNWCVRPLALGRRMKWGRDKIYNVLNLLIDRGYIERRQERDPASGSFNAVTYLVYDLPFVAPAREIRETRLPDLPLPENQKAAKRVSTDSYQEQPPKSPKAPDAVRLTNIPVEKDRASSRSAPAWANKSSFKPPPKVWVKRGKAESDLAARLGPDGFAILCSLPETELIGFCRQQEAGTLDAVIIGELRLRYTELKLNDHHAEDNENACSPDPLYGGQEPRQ
jgi:hypothetical protein